MTRLRTSRRYKARRALHRGATSPGSMASKKMMSKAAEIEKRLAALEGPEWDSDDEMPAAAAASAKAAKKGSSDEKKKPSKKEKKRLAAERREKEDKSRVIYVGHVPHGFYEDQMRGFFSQFGEVTRLRLSRSKKTGGSKGYGFIEFADSETARIAAATMDKYLMHGKQLVAHVTPLELAQHPRLFAHSDKAFLKRIGAKEQAERDAKPKTQKQCDATTRALLKKEVKKRKHLAEEFPGYAFPGYAGADERRTADADEADADEPPAKKPASAKKNKATPSKSAEKKTKRKKTA